MVTIKHLAIIPDGNRRWAKVKGLPLWQGHIKASKNIPEIIKGAFALGINSVTIWGGSYDNLTKRAPKEIEVLNRIYSFLSARFLKSRDVRDGKVRLRILGEWKKLLKDKTKEDLIRAETATKKNGPYNLTLLIGYNGDREMVKAINKLVRAGSKIDEEDIKRAIWTKDLLPVDLIIRTGGEPHLSAGFMMWDVRYAQLYFTEKLWPDFDVKDLKEAVGCYEGRERRQGK
mgnify:CR=1 FL=1